MRIVRPAPITDAALIASNLPETVAVWSAGTTYAAGAQVRSEASHTTWESLQAGNIAHPLTDPAWWFEVGPTNRWAMFDAVNGTISTGATGIDVTLQPAGRVDSLALLNLSAASARVTVTDVADGGVFDETFTLVSDSGITDWYAYFYEPIVRRTDLIVTDIPLYVSPSIRIRLDDGGGPASIGTVVVGQSKRIGDTSQGASVGITDYSRKEADEFGNYVLVERAFSRKGSFSVAIEAGQVDEVFRLLAGYRATPLLYVGSTRYGATAIFGFYRDFNIEIAHPTLSFCSLELEGLT